LNIAKAEWVNILEEGYPEGGPCEFSKKGDVASIKLDFRLFEIKTLKLVLA
jgi:hypothetical protein